MNEYQYFNLYKKNKWICSNKIYKMFLYKSMLNT